MSRSNGQSGQPPGRGQQWRQPVEPDFYAQPAPAHPQGQPPQHAQGQPDQGQWAPPAPAQHPGYPPVPPQQHGYAQAAAYPDPQPYYPPAPPAPGAYVDPQQSAPAGYDRRAQYVAPPAPASQQYAPQWPGQAQDTANYDLSSYAPPGQQPGYAPEPAWDQNATQPGYAQAPAPAYGRGQPQQGYANPQHIAYDTQPQSGYAPQPAYGAPQQPAYRGAPGDPSLELGTYGAAPVALGHHDQGHADTEYEDDVEYEDEPPRKRRALMVVAGLVCAIGVGAGLAYGYTKILKPGFDKTATLKADSQPGKQKLLAVNAAGGVDPKLPNRLADDVAGQRVAGTSGGTDDRSVDDDPNGPRRVKTIPIGVVPMRGVALENADGPPPVAAGRVLPQAPSAARPAPRAPSPVVADVTPVPPQVRVANAVPAEPAPARVAAPKPPVVPKQKVAKASDAFNPAGGATATAAVATGSTESAARPPAASALGKGGAGFVAVVASAKSRIDALKSFADLQQKFGSVLTDKAADVQESDQSARGLGTVYRAVVGPPGSREQARQVCQQLQAAGSKSECWVTAF